MAESKFLEYQDANGDGLIDVCDDIIEVNEEYCPGCIPNPCATVPIWQNRRKWEPFLNERIVKYQITKGTWRTTTDLDEAPPSSARSAGSFAGAPVEGALSPGASPEISFAPTSPSMDPIEGAQHQPGSGGAPEFAPPDTTLTNEDGGIAIGIFNEYADEIVEALLAAYGKDQSEGSKNIIKRYLEYTDWDLKPRPMSRLKLLYSVPCEVLQSIPEAEEEEDEEIDTSDIEVSFSAEDLELKLIRVRKGLNLYDRYRRAFQKIEKSGIYYLNPEAFGKAQVFDLENYGDSGFSSKSIMAKVWTDLKQFLKDKGYYLSPGSAIRGTKKKVGKVTFTLTYKYRLKKIIIYTEACPLDPIVYLDAAKQLAKQSEAYADVTAMAYLAHLADMENDLIARVPVEWTEFLVKYTYPEIYVSTYPEELYEGGEIAACIGEALAGEGKQIGEDILDAAFSLGDSIAWLWHETLCSKSEEDIKAMRAAAGVGPDAIFKTKGEDYQEEGAPNPGAPTTFNTGDTGQFRRADGESIFRPRLSADAQAQIVADYAHHAEQGYNPSIVGMAKMQAYGYVQENPMLFDFLCTWLGGSGITSWMDDNIDIWNRFKLCGLLDMLAQVIQCLTGGLTLEEALASILTATFQGMSINNFDKFFIGLSAEEQAELDALVKEKLDNGDIFADDSNMAAVGDDVVGNYDPGLVEAATPATTQQTTITTENVVIDPGVTQDELNQAYQDALNAFDEAALSGADADALLPAVAAANDARRSGATAPVTEAITTTTTTTTDTTTGDTYSTGITLTTTTTDATTETDGGAYSGTTTTSGGISWSGWSDFYQNTVKGSSWDATDSATSYDPSGYGGMTENEYDSYMEQSRRSLAPSAEGGDSWTEFIAGDTDQLSESVIIEAYTKALLEKFKGMELELVDRLNTLPGAPLIASIIATTACPQPAFMKPSFTDIIKDFELPWTCGREFVWPSIVFSNPFKNFLKVKDILFLLFEKLREKIDDLLWEIIFALMVKLCQIVGNTVCRALELTGDILASVPDLLTGRDNLSNIIREAICGPDVADEVLNKTIVDMVALMGDAGAALVDEEYVLELAASLSGLVTQPELQTMILGQDAGEAPAAIATYMGFEYPEFPALHTERGVINMFKNMGNLMPIDFRDQLQQYLDAVPSNDMKPANPTLCATPEQIEKFCELRATLMQDRASPEQIKKLCDRQGIKDNLEELVKPFQDFDNHIACNMPPLISDPGCDNGILPYEPEEAITSTTSMLSDQLEALKSDFSTDMMGNGPFDKNWGLVNMVLSDTMASPLTVHRRKAANGWPMKDYVNFYTLDDASAEEYGEGSGKLWQQKGAYPLYVAEWLSESLSKLTPQYQSNNELQDDLVITKDFDDYTRGLFHKHVDIVSLPDFGYNVEISIGDPRITVTNEDTLGFPGGAIGVATELIAPDPDTITFVKKARKATPDLELLFEDNAQGKKSLYGVPFYWGFKLGFFNADLKKTEDPETGTQTFHTSPGDVSRIQIHTYNNETAEVDSTLASLVFDPSLRKKLSRSFSTSSVIVDLKYEFVSVDNALGQIGSETLSQYPEFLSMFETADYSDYSPPVVLLSEVLKDAGYHTNKADIEERYNTFMSSITNMIINDVAGNQAAFDYGADFDTLTKDELDYVVDEGQTLSPGGTPYGDAEMAHEDDPSKMRPIQNVDQILGISRMEWLLKSGQKEGENRIYYLDPVTYGGNYMNPPLYIKPLQPQGWLGFVNVLFPELSPCKPFKSDLVDFGEIQDKVTESYPNIPEDERLLQHPDCSEEWPFNRILDRSAVAGLQGLITAAIRIYSTAHFIKSMATFTKFYPKFPQVFSSLYASYVVENMEESFKDASYTLIRNENPKDDDFWYGFLEQSVQMYARRLEAEEIEAPAHVIGAITRLNDFTENEWKHLGHEDRREDYWLYETNRLRLKKYRYDKVLEAVRVHEEDAKLIMKELVIEELNYMGEKFISNLDAVGMTPDVFDLDYYLLENLAQGGDNLSVDHEIKLTYPNLPTEPGPIGEPYYTHGAEFVVFEDNDLENEYHVGQEYVGYYVVHISEGGEMVFLAGEEYIAYLTDDLSDPASTTTQSEYVQDVLAPLVNQTSIDIGDVAEYGFTPESGDARPFRIEKYIKVRDEILSPSDAVFQIQAGNPDLALNISDVYPGPEGNELRFVEDEEGNVVGVEGELGVRYGLMFSIVIDGVKYEITSVEVDALDLPLSEFKTLEANSKLLLCLINLLKEDGKFKLISKYIFPLSKITATTAIYNDMAFLKSIGEVTVEAGDTWATFKSGLSNQAGKPGTYVDITTAEDDEDNTYIENVELFGNPGWAAESDRKRTTTFTTYDEWSKELLINSKRQIKRLFKVYYNSRDFAPYGTGPRPGQHFMDDLKARLVPASGQRLLPWWKKKRLRSNPFNTDGELCENED